MGKTLVIKDANFVDNAINEREYVMDSIPSESLSWSSTSNYSARAWTNETINSTSCYYSTVYGAKVKCNPGTFVKLFAIKGDGSYRFLQRFDISSSATTGSWQTLVLDNPATMDTDEYLGVCSNTMYYAERSGGTGFYVNVTDGTGTGTYNSTSANVFPFHRIYELQ